jgi:DNA-binding MarR family transcriptional regulator
MKKIVRGWEISPAVLRGKDRRWEVTKKRAEAVAALVRENGFSVTEVAAYLRRDPANVSMMLSRLSAKAAK